MTLLNTNELHVRALSVRAVDLVYLRSLLEASEGLGFFVAKKGGDVLLVTTSSQANELDRFIADLSSEIPMENQGSQVYEEVVSVLGG